MFSQKVAFYLAKSKFLESKKLVLTMQKVAFRGVKSYFLLTVFAGLQITEFTAVGTRARIHNAYQTARRANYCLLGRRFDQIGNLRTFFFIFFFYIYFYIFACVHIFTRM